eukprot:TRINITY_DN8072_c0_g1_i1.p1 TRINITY_DN8072_c0_g1~~TRINITY_DN8072_c0_g1_i1.p1  ORF type:complete len:418 (-),score=102.08 TRINITY_DN8072_c0_g1_i1:112-1365(-)
MKRVTALVSKFGSLDFIIKYSYIYGLIVRLFIVGFVHQAENRLSSLKYTDLDYSVFTDGARYLLKGQTPYDRHTYRYTPLLAYLMIPNLSWNYSFGKVLFAISDSLCGYYLKKILHLTTKLERVQIDRLVLLWTFNPMVINLSTRGSADTLVCLLCVLFLYHLIKGNITRSALFYGLVVHFKIYPILYSLPIYFFIDHQRKASTIFLRNRIKFAALSASVFIVLFIIFYAKFGSVFLNETYLYHLSRKDNRHNFSIFFYFIYLNYDQISPIISILAFLPQVIVIGTAGIKLYKDIIFCVFVQTFAFVIFNKVVTAQYFVWYLIYLPLILARSNLFTDAKKRWLLIYCAAIWLAVEFLWMMVAFQLEFKGVNVFLELWGINILFFLVNCGILWLFITNHHYSAAAPASAPTQKKLHKD